MAEMMPPSGYFSEFEGTYLASKRNPDMLYLKETFKVIRKYSYSSWTTE